MNALVSFARNLLAGLYASVGLRAATGHLRASPGQLIALALLPVVAAGAYDLVQAGAQAQFNGYALPGRLFPVLGWLLAAYALCVALGRRERMLHAAVAIAATCAVITLLFVLVAAISPRWWTRLGRDAYAVFGWAAWSWPAVVATLAAVRASQAPATAEPQPAAAPAHTPRGRNLLAGLACLVLLLGPAWLIGPAADQPLWWAPEEATGGDARDALQAPASEAVLYAQPGLLDAALAAVPAGKPGRTELFYIGFAAYGRQNVFLNEVVQVEQLLHERFALEGRGVVLANHASSALERPFATVASLKRSLDTVAKKMNRDEDVLLLFLTSHGARDHQLSIEMWPYRFDTLTPAALGAALDAAGVRYAVIVVQACYSGGFIEPLANPDRLVITASRADRNSFGCTDGADWTYFGRAFFAEALRETTSFEQAFSSALPRIAERERAEQYTASEPQIAAGAAIRARLEALQSRLAGAPPAAGRNAP